MSQQQEQEVKKPAAEEVDHSKDLVIRDGFPALLDPSTGKWWIDETDETMKFPRWPFWSQDDALEFKEEASLTEDCRKVFTARTRDDNASYSAGTTYFLPALMKPRCALEGLVQSIFQQHAKILPEGMYKPDQSGAEWWTLVLGDEEKDEESKKKNEAKQSANTNKGEEEKEEEEEEEEDDVGWHYDADYGLEDQAPGLLLHPRVATVTYLTNCGAPTVVTDCLTPKQGKVQHLEGLSIRKAYVSYPKLGKHMAFDGRLLHGAPSDIFPSLEALSSPGKKKDEEEPPTKRLKTDDGDTQQQTAQPRITLLVNVWLNHCPLDAELLDDEVIDQLQTPWDDNSKDNMFQWKADLTKATTLGQAHVEAAPKAAAAKDDEDTLEDEIVLCNHRVRVHYGTNSLEDYHSAIATTVAGNSASSIAVDLAPGTLTLQVGDPVSEDESEAEEEEG